jgi:hypothetical protein
MAITLFQAAMLAGTALQASSALSAGRAAQQTAAMRMRQQQIQIEQNRIQARDKANQRERQFETAQASNRAMFAFMNRDLGSDRSYAAFLKRQEEIKGDDRAALDFTATAQQQQMLAQGQQSLVEGQIKAKQYQMSALTSIATGLYQYDLVRT